MLFKISFFYSKKFFHIRNKKKEYRCTPTFVNLKSNTMKNTVQRYGLYCIMQIFK